MDTSLPRASLSILLVTMLSLSSPVSGLNSVSSYIVLMDPTKMPAIFNHYEAWYSSLSTKLTYVYNNKFQGFSGHLTALQVEAVKKLNGFVVIFEERVHQLHTTRTPEFLSLNSSAGIWPETDYGSNVIIGFLDTGIWPESASFRDTGIGPVPTKWKGFCEAGVGFNSSHCNNKLIGARYYYKGYLAYYGALNWSTEYASARDSNGHGTHTASIAAGNYATNASLFGLAQGTARGMAPKARIAAYKVCWEKGYCADSDIIAGMDQAVADGVDIISMSLGSSAMAYQSDVIAIGAFAASKNGIFFSASAGNDGPYTYSVSNTAPWITTVGAGTIDRSFPATAVLGNGVAFNGQSLYSGKGLENVQTPLVYLGYCDTEESVNSSVASGKIVVCDFFYISISQGMNVSKAGGVGMIVVMDYTLGNSTFPESYTLPALAITYTDGVELKKYINSTQAPTSTIKLYGTLLGAKPAPQVPFFSSRGPNIITKDVLKPDVIAPGFNILASWSGVASPSGLLDDNRRVEYNIDSGTSMSCPHVSGIAALLKAAHPSWSPAAIKSAIMTTSYISDNTGANISDATTGYSSNVFAYGSGHVDPQKALNPGLVYDLTEQDYINFLCSYYTSQDLLNITQNNSLSCPAIVPPAQEFNYPSFTAVFNYSGSGEVSTTFGRVVTNVGDAKSTYTVSVVAPKEMNVTITPPLLAFTELNQTLSFRVLVTAPALVEWYPDFKSAVLSWSDGVHIVQSPITLLISYD